MLTNVVEPRFRWSLPGPVNVPSDFAEAGRRLGYSERLVGLLARRGVSDAELPGFSGPAEGALFDPALLPDAAAFRDRVLAARARGERVQVFGDFDADGLTGLAILVRVLRRLDVDVVPYVPDRLEEGHGLSLAAVAAAEVAGCRVIITVDTGTSSAVEIAAANQRGLDVLVTDHHRVPAVLPPALVVVNPQRADSVYPHRRLAGSGVAFKLAQLLLADQPDGPHAALDLADLATIGTVADVAPILGENRAIARLGLERMRRAPRAGIAALLGRASVGPGGADLETVAFAIAPRINAAGRVGEAVDAAALLLTDDPEEAARLAEKLDEANLTRRKLTRDVVAEAESSIADLDAGAAAVIVRGEWPVGIVGLVASRIAERTGKPAVVGAVLGDVVRASCRSQPGFDLADALGACADLLTRYGGHAGAAGFELPADRWEAFAERFVLLARTALPEDARPTLQLDLALTALEVDYALLRELASLAPTGPGNPAPLIAVSGLTVTRVRPATGGHTQITLKRTIDVLDGIAFGREDLATSLREGDHIDVAARVMTRVFGGYESLQLEIRDVAPAGWAAAQTVAALASGSPVLAVAS